MTLADLRRLAVRRQIKISFRMAAGPECVVDEHGIARSTAPRTAGALNFEHELASAGEFMLGSAANGQNAGRARAVSREELEAMLSPSSAPSSSVAEEE